MFVYQIAIELFSHTLQTPVNLFTTNAKDFEQSFSPTQPAEKPRDYRLSKIHIEFFDKPEKMEEKNDEREVIQFVTGNTEIITGIVHLYRSEKKFLPQESDLRTICLLGIPSHMSSSELLTFMRHYQESIVSLRLVRDCLPNRYIAFINFENSQVSKSFQKEFHRKPFNSIEPEICNALFIERIDFKGLESINAYPLDYGLIELPTCPVCLERMDSSVTGIFSLSCNHTFHCNCLSKWNETSCPVCRYGRANFDETASECFMCGETHSLWMCLICGNIGCGRYNQGHAYQHFQQSHHPYSIEVETQRVWDYVGDGYVHRLICNNADGKLVELPSNDANPEGEDEENEIGSHSPRNTRPNDHSRGGFSKEKIEAVAKEYGILLTTQLESQRAHFQSLLSNQEGEFQKLLLQFQNDLKAQDEERRKLESQLDGAIKEKKNMEKRLTQSVTKQVQMAKELSEEKTMVQALIDNQEKMKLLDQEKDKRIQDLEDQMRDLMFYLDAQKKVESSPQKDEIQSGQLGIQEKERKTRRKK